MIEDIRDEVRSLDTSQRSLRKFGCLVGAVFLFLSLWMSFKGKYPLLRNLCGFTGAPLLILGLVAPDILKAFYKVWMGAAFAMGWVVSRILLLAIFFLILTPIGFVGRLFGNEFLDIKSKSSREDYWVKRKKSRVDYEKLY